MIQQASVNVSCQKCGGTASPVLGQDYCRCSYCTSLIQPNEVSADRIQPAGVTLDCHCPSCSQPLQTALIEGCRALYCSACLGILVRHQDFGQIVQKRQANRVGIEPAEPRPIKPAAFERHLDCPSCRTRMEVHPYYGPGNIVVDSCVECSYMWLDHGELTRVEQASWVRQSNAHAWNSEAQSDAERLQEVRTLPQHDESADLSLRSIADLLFYGLR